MRTIKLTLLILLLSTGSHAQAICGVDSTAPTFSSASIGTDGTTLTINFSEACSRGSAYVDDWDFNDGSDVGCTYSSADETATSASYGYID